MVGQECVDEVALALERGQLTHPAQMRRPLGVEVALGGAAQHEGEDHLDEEIGLEVRRRLDGLAQPRLEFVLPPVRDGVELSIGSPSRLHLSRRDLPVTGEAGQGGIDLAEIERFASAEVGVVVALEVVAIARFTLEEAKEGKGNAHVATIH